MKGAGYRIHRETGTPNDLHIFTVSGSGLVRVGSDEFWTEPGEWTVWPEGTPHDYGRPVPRPTSKVPGRSARHWEQLWFHVKARPHWSDYLKSAQATVTGKHRLYRYLPDQRAPGVTDELLAMARRLERSFKYYEASTAVHFHQLEGMLLRLSEGSSIAEIPLPPGPDPRIDRAIIYAQKNLAQRFTVKEWADFVGLSESRFGHLFTAQVGETPVEHLERLRLERAWRLLLQTNLKVGEIASICGYANIHYFSNRFTAYYGVRPSSVRSGNSQPGSVAFP